PASRCSERRRCRSATFARGSRPRRETRDAGRAPFGRAHFGDRGLSVMTTAVLRRSLLTAGSHLLFLHPSLLSGPRLELVFSGTTPTHSMPGCSPPGGRHGG